MGKANMTAAKRCVALLNELTSSPLRACPHTGTKCCLCRKGICFGDHYRWFDVGRKTIRAHEACVKQAQAELVKR